MIKVIFVCLFSFIVSACVTTSSSKGALEVSQSLGLKEYKIEFVRVEKKLRSGRAVFKLFGREGSSSSVGQKWEYVKGKNIALTHIGNELIVSDELLTTNENGEFSFTVKLKDSLKYFSWVKKSSYAINSLYLEGALEPETIVPYQVDNEWAGWAKAMPDMSFFIKAEVEAVTYWLPVRYKDVRPLIKEVTHQVYHEKIEEVTFNLTRYGKKIKGVDIYLLGQGPDKSSLLNEYFTNEAYLKYAEKVIPDYVNGEAGGYDVETFFVYPGEYTLKVMGDSKALYMEPVNISKGGERVREVVIN